MTIKVITCFICEEGTVYFGEEWESKICPECGREFTSEGEVPCEKCDGTGGFAEYGDGKEWDCGYCDGKGWVAHDYDYEILTKEDIAEIKGDIKFHELRDEGLI